MPRQARFPLPPVAGVRPGDVEGQAGRHPMARQVCLPPESAEVHQDNPLDYLYSSASGEESGVNMVTVDDKGSHSQCARVLLQDVPMFGIVDSGADTTILVLQLSEERSSRRLLR